LTELFALSLEDGPIEDVEDEEESDEDPHEGVIDVGHQNLQPHL